MSRYSSSEAFIQSHFEQEKNAILDIYRKLDLSNKGFITVADLRQGLVMQGLDPFKNPRVMEDEERLLKSIRMSNNEKDNIEDFKIGFDEFFQLLSDKENQNIITRALLNELAVPDWPEFCKQLKEIFEEARANTDGHPADYIPQLATADQNLYGLSLCTVDGQQFSCGDHSYEFTIQSCSKVFTYCVACDELGPEKVHDHIGFEPSGVSFNAFTLDDNNKPHNPMINAGAITTCSLIKPEMKSSNRFTFMSNRLAEFAGGRKVGFDNATFLSEKDTADRNFALAHYMTEHNVFPKGTNIQDTLDFYFQLCSCLVDTDRLSVMSATLANGGICPLNNKKVVSSATVKCALQLMLGCGMYDFSGEWACTVGLPAKSGVSGAVTVVVPSVMGVTVFSPRLGKRGNSERGVDFFTRASGKFGWNIFDQLFAQQDDQDEDDVDQEQERSPQLRPDTPLQPSQPKQTRASSLEAQGDEMRRSSSSFSAELSNSGMESPSAIRSAERDRKRMRSPSDVYKGTINNQKRYRE
ncbi:glutaminase [Acrasis kona]|uniref:glutaminase n=1 Tax=Acrasis kona TaxID=1008807 RepID=A0AAW2ZQS4_9EUKA